MSDRALDRGVAFRDDVASIASEVRARLLRVPRLSPSDLSGAFADLGLLIPLEASLIAVNGLNPTSTLLGVGILYVAAGWYFRIPMPVQPLKALAAVAIAQRLSPEVIAAGALLMSISLALLAVTGVIDRVYAVLPVVVVRGIQLGLAYILLKGAILMLQKPLAPGDPQPDVVYGSLSLPLMLVVAPAVLLIMLLLLKKPLIPASIAVLACGIAVGLALNMDQLSSLRFGPERMSFSTPGVAAFSTAAALLLTAQLPLTIANSVVATADAARAYFPERASRVTPKRLSLSIALGNLWAGFAGGLPVCHGSGGLTAHYSFGARQPASTAITGATLIPSRCSSATRDSSCATSFRCRSSGCSCFSSASSTPASRWTSAASRTWGSC